MGNPVMVWGKKFGSSLEIVDHGTGLKIRLNSLTNSVALELDSEQKTELLRAIAPEMISENIDGLGETKDELKNLKADYEDLDAELDEALSRIGYYEKQIRDLKRQIK